jgi:hypothetical protein
VSVFFPLSFHIFCSGNDIAVLSDEKIGRTHKIPFTEQKVVYFRSLLIGFLILASSVFCEKLLLFLQLSFPLGIEQIWVLKYESFLIFKLFSIESGLTKHNFISINFSKHPNFASN